MPNPIEVTVPSLTIPVDSLGFSNVFELETLLVATSDPSSVQFVPTEDFKTIRKVA